MAQLRRINVQRQVSLLMISENEHCDLHNKLTKHKAVVHGAVMHSNKIPLRTQLMWTL